MRLSRIILIVAALAALLAVAACGDETRDGGATEAEVDRLREEARARLDDLRERIDDAFGR